MDSLKDTLTSLLEEARDRLLEQCLQKNDMVAYVMLQDYDCDRLAGDNDAIMKIVAEAGVEKVREIKCKAESYGGDRFSQQGLAAFLVERQIERILGD